MSEREDLQKLLDKLGWKYKVPEQREGYAQAEKEPVAWLSLSDTQWMNIVNDLKILELTGGRHDSEDAVNLAVKMTEDKCKANNIGVDDE